MEGSDFKKNHQITQMNLEMLQTRASIIKQIRSFFDNRGYLELDTPLLCDNLIPESCLEVFETHRLFPHGSKKESKPLWLIPSPEIWMKKIIAQQRVNVFQICKCFRNGESEGHLHNCEFTMLEYYTMGADYMDSLILTEELIKSFYSESHKRREPATFKKITVKDAFKQYAGFDLFAAADEGADALSAQARKLGLDPPTGMSVPELYDLIFIHAVEPGLKTENPVFLIDYPAFVPCLALQRTENKKQRTINRDQLTENKEHGGTVERWELYWNGIELANCFSEETEPQKVKEFFISEETAKKQNAVVKHNVDHDYWKIFESFPKCSGTAMGVDRLIMALTGKACIEGVLPFHAG